MISIKLNCSFLLQTTASCSTLLSCNLHLEGLKLRHWTLVTWLAIQSRIVTTQYDLAIHLSDSFMSNKTHLDRLLKIRDQVNILSPPPPPPPQIDQVKILHPSAEFRLNLLSAVCKMLDSDWLKIPILEPS